MSKSKKNRSDKNGNGNMTKPKETPVKPSAAAAAPAAKEAAVSKGASPAARLSEAKHNRFAIDFSQAVAVLMRAPNYKNLRIGELEWLLIPPLLSGQFKVAVSRYSNEGPVVPVALALWARVSDAVDKRLSQNLDKAPVLRANEWTSGNNVWLIATAGETKAVAGLLADLYKSEFKNAPAKLRVSDAKGNMTVQVLKPSAESSKARD